MPGLVIDASTVLAVVLPDEADARANLAMRIMSRDGALVPAHWPLEVANGLLMAERRKRISRSLRHETLVDLSDMLITFDDRTQEMAWNASGELAAAHKLTLYDAAYLELALRSGLPLATLDGGLISAARSEGVALIEAS